MSRKKRMGVRRWVAVWVLFLFLVPVIWSGVWFVRSRKKDPDTGLISPLVEGLVKVNSQSEQPISVVASATPEIEKKTAPGDVTRPFDGTTPTPFPLTTTVEEILKKSGIGSVAGMDPDPGFQIPEQLTPFTATDTISLQRGKMTARFTADWTNIETPIIWVNFSGSTKTNLFEILGSGQMLFFNNYDETGVLADSLAVELVNDYKGREFTFEARWDFAKNPGVKEIVLDGIVAGHEEVNFTPSGTPQSGVYAWLVDELIFSAAW